MAVPNGYTVVSIVVPVSVHDRLHRIAKQRGLSVNRMLAGWLATGVEAPVVRAGKRQSVRRKQDELMISLPRDWQRRAGVHAGDRVDISYSDDALIIKVKGEA
jgi:hypothetical protein